MSSIQLHSRSMQDTIEIGKRLATILRLGDVIALSGLLGAGKTQLTRGLAAGLGVNPRQIASPTFILMSEYEGRVPVVHIDAYRVQRLADLESIGFTPELLNESVTIIEWADRIASDLPETHCRIDLIHTETGRDLVIHLEGRFQERATKVIEALNLTEKYSLCAVCKAVTAVESNHFPFCSSRCKLVDLNRWFNGDYSLSRPVQDEDLDAQA